MASKKKAADQAVVDAPVLRAGCLHLGDDSGDAQVNLVSTHAKVPLRSSSAQTFSYSDPLSFTFPDSSSVVQISDSSGILLVSQETWCECQQL